VPMYISTIADAYDSAPAIVLSGLWRMRDWAAGLTGDRSLQGAGRAFAWGEGSTGAAIASDSSIGRCSQAQCGARLHQLATLVRRPWIAD
jgi:hypothetical protein